MDKLLERFLQYVSLDTQSKPGVRQVPSTEGQWKLLNLLKEQMEAMGLVDVTLSEKGTVMGTLPANVPGDIPAIGFISHVDTSPDFSGKHVNPQIVENYRGGDTVTLSPLSSEPFSRVALSSSMVWVVFLLRKPLLVLVCSR